MTSLSDRFLELETRLGVARGPLTSALIAVVDQPLGSPIWRCDFYLDFPEPLEFLTPKNVALFGSTGIDFNQFGFVVPEERGGTTDELVVCLVRPSSGDTVLMPSLAGFLSLVAVAGTEAIEASASDDDFWDARKSALGVDAFEEASALLCTLPGVAIPTSPSRLIGDCPVPELFYDKRRSSVVSLDAVRACLDDGDPSGAREVLLRLIGKFLDLGDFVPAANWKALEDLLALAQPRLSEEHRAALKSRRVDLRYLD